VKLHHGTQLRHSGRRDSKPELRSLLTKRSGSAILIATVGLASILYVSLLKADRFGAYHDDGIYVATAKALAEGQGYRIISLPNEPAQTKYPPLYPFVLSLIWRAYPQFPQNIILMMLGSVVATVGFLILTRRYLVKCEYGCPRQASIIVAMTALNWRTMILATSVYSEMLFALLAVAALHLAEKDESAANARLRGALLGVLIGLAFLTRTSGIALLISVALYYSAKRQWRRAVLPVSVAALFVIGWIAWCYVNRTNAQNVNVLYYTSYISHLNEVVRDLQAASGSSKLGVLFNMAVENFVGGVLISVPLVTTGLSYNSFARLSGSPLAAALGAAFLSLILIVVGLGRALGERIRLLHIYLVMSLGMYLLWIPNVSYDRFLMPMLPFFLLFLVSELGVLGSLASKGLRSPERGRKISGVVVASVPIIVAAIAVFGYTSGVYSSVVSLRTSATRAADDTQAISWIRENSDAADVLVCYRDPKFFLYTDRKAVRSFPMTEGYSWEEDRASMDRLAKVMFRIIAEAGARYMVVTATDFELEQGPEQHRKTFDRIIEQHPRNFTLVFQSTDGRNRIYRTEVSIKDTAFQEGSSRDQ
jgi:hypothetical protein